MSRLCAASRGFGAGGASARCETATRHENNQQICFMMVYTSESVRTGAVADAFLLPRRPCPESISSKFAIGVSSGYFR